MAVPSGRATARGTGRARTVVLVGGLAQGVALVSFPASESVLRAASDGFGLSSTQYGQLFLPQVGFAILTSLGGGAVSRRLGLKRVLLVGLIADVVAMVLLALAALVADGHPEPGYGILLVATAFLGAGFGFTVPALNSFAADLVPSAPGREVLRLNALLGSGTALAPVLSAVFVGIGIWWGLPILAGVLLVGTALGVVPLAAPRASPATPAATAARAAGGPTWWLVIATALSYGVVETMAGTWGQPLARTDLHVSATIGSVVLAVFWAGVTVGRVFFSVLEARLSPRVVYCVLPFVVAAGLAAVRLVPDRSSVGAIVVFAVIGIGCSALLPQTVSTAQSAFPARAAAMSSVVIAAYEVGYGVAAFGVGPLHDRGIGLSAAFGVAAAVALLVGAGTIALTLRTRTPGRSGATGAG